MRVLLVEDEPELAGLIARNIGQHGYVVDRVRTVADAGCAARVVSYGLVLLDRRLPDGDGLDALKELRRAQSGLPIIVVSALDSVGARVEGLECGADDYLTKPFAFEELLARMRATIRRGNRADAPCVQCGQLTFHPAARTVEIGGEPIVFSRRELALLEALILRAGRVVQRSALMDSVYSLDDEVQDNTLDSLVRRVRRRCADAEAGVEIYTARGLGYVLRPAPS